MAASAPAQDRPLRELRGVVERITYQNPENGFTVARLAPERPESEAEAARGDDWLVTIVGTLPDLTPGEAIVAHGWWRNDPKHGWQFQATDYRTSLPASLQGMKKYIVGPCSALGGSMFCVFAVGHTWLVAVPVDLATPARAARH